MMTGLPAVILTAGPSPETRGSPREGGITREHLMISIVTGCLQDEGTVMFSQNRKLCNLLLSLSQTSDHSDAAPLGTEPE